MATMRDLDELALALSGATKELDKEGRPRYVARRKWFAFHRAPRKDAPFDDVLAFRVENLDVKELMLADPRGIWFTTPHWDGYKAVLMRIPDLKQLKKSELRAVLEDAYLATS
jgi:hypothetical protein